MSVATMASVARQIDSIRHAGAEVDVVQMEGLPRLRYLQCYPVVRSRAGSADVIHAHYGYCGWLAWAQRQAPVVISFMGTDLLGVPDADGKIRSISGLVARADRWLATRADAVIVKSPEMARLVGPAEPHVIPNGVDLEQFKPMDRGAARERLGWKADRPYVLFGGNPNNPRKGFPLATQAVRAAARAHAEPLEVVALRGVAAELVPVYMNAADVLLMTSLLEGSPNVVKEAMACNLPVVAVDVGDVADLLDGVRDSAVAPRDPELLGEALARLANGRRSNGRDMLRAKRLDSASVARRIVALYDQLVHHTN
jgi:glycosyltransferase involved in cell wall biosynthesis